MGLICRDRRIRRKSGRNNRCDDGINEVYGEDIYTIVVNSCTTSMTSCYKYRCRVLSLCTARRLALNSVFFLVHLND